MLFFFFDSLMMLLESWMSNSMDGWNHGWVKSAINFRHIIKIDAKQIPMPNMKNFKIFLLSNLYLSSLPVITCNPPNTLEEKYTNLDLTKNTDLEVQRRGLKIVRCEKDVNHLIQFFSLCCASTWYLSFTLCSLFFTN